MALNPDRRPQRLYGKVAAAMNVVDERINNKKYTAIGQWLNQADLGRFRKTVRDSIRTELNATIDSWPQRVLHDYRPQVRQAILKAVEEHWEMFEVPYDKAHDETELCTHDEFILAELVFEPFYNE